MVMPATYYEPVLTSSHPGYQTPLGDIPIDVSAVNQTNTGLTHELGKGLSRVSHDPEHSLEIELPFLQRALKPGWKLLPIMVHGVEPHTSQILGKVIASVVKGKDYLLVASTDLSHFYDQETAKKLDTVMLSQIEAFSPEGVFETERTGKGFACGLSALASVLWAGRELGADQVMILKHATSGDVIGDHTSVVGYGAAAILKH
jgi:AmmeMemoRadiSam system protein B